MMEARAFEYDFRVEEITRSQAEAILESIRAHVMDLGAVMAGGFSEDEPGRRLDNEHSNIYTPEPLTEELDDLYAHPRSCNCPYCNGEIPPDLEAQLVAAEGPDPIYDHDSSLEHFSKVEKEAIVDMALLTLYLVQFETEDEQGFTTEHRYFVSAHAHVDALERMLIYMAGNNITSRDGITPLITTTEVKSIPVI
jgi:hypothetical protein